jgi:hypothetical protein
MARKPHVPRSKNFSDGVPATDPDKVAKAAKNTEKERASARALKESRIETIAGMMRQFQVGGQLTWTRKIRLGLGKAWGLNDNQMMVLSGEAHKIVALEVDDPESIRRNVGAVMQDALVDCSHKKDHKGAAIVSTVMIKLAEGAAKKVEVVVELKQPTPADAARAMQEVFGTRVLKLEDTETRSIADNSELLGDTGEAESADSAPEDPSED